MLPKVIICPSCGSEYRGSARSGLRGGMMERLCREKDGSIGSSRTCLCNKEIAFTMTVPDVVLATAYYGTWSHPQVVLRALRIEGAFLVCKHYNGNESKFFLKTGKEFKGKTHIDEDEMKLALAYLKEKVDEADEA
jgi:hypothetical protein